MTAYTLLSLFPRIRKNPVNTSAQGLDGGWWLVVLSLNCVWLFVTLWTIAHKAPLSMGFPRWEYGSGLSFSWVAIFSSRGSSWPRVWTCVSCLPGGFFTTVLRGLDTSIQTHQQHTLGFVEWTSKSLMYFPKLWLAVLLMWLLLIMYKGQVCWEGNIFVIYAYNGQVRFS